MTFDTNIPRDRGRSRFRLSPSRIGLCAILAALAMASPAHAHPDTRPQKPSRVGAPPPSAAAERPTRWYGYQGAIADAAAGALLYGAISTFRLCFSTCDNSTATLMLLGSLGTYAFGAPVIHVTHGRVDKAALSFGMRVTPFIAAASLAGEESRASAPVLFGGILAAIVVDHVVLAHEPVEDPVVRVSPSIDPGRRSAALVLDGAF